MSLSELLETSFVLPSSLLARLLLRGLGPGARIWPSASFKGHRRITAGRGLVVREHSLIAAGGRHVRLGDDCYVDRNVLISAHGGWIEIGNRCSFNPNCAIYGAGGLRIGNGVRVAANTVIIPASHNFDDPDVPIVDQGVSRKGIVIEDDVWIGANCVITDGVTIRRGAVIGAGSVVTRDIPELCIAVGSPAKVIRRRGEAASCERPPDASPSSVL